MNKSNFRFSDPILLKFTFEINENFLAEAEKEFYVGQKFHVEVSRNPSEAGSSVCRLWGEGNYPVPGGSLSGAAAPQPLQAATHPGDRSG